MSFSGWKGPRRITTLWKDIGRLLCASCNFYRPIMLCKWTYIVISKLCDCKGIKSVHLKRNLSWIFIGWIDAEAEALILWPPDVKNWLIGKKPDVGKGWRHVEKGMTENEMVGWHHWLKGFEFEQAPRVGDGQEAWHAAVHGVKKSWTQLSDWTELKLCECFVSVCFQVMWSSIFLHRWSVACLHVYSVMYKCLWTHGLYSPPGPSVHGIFQARKL